MRYRLFRRKSNNSYYFQFLTDDNQTVLESKGYDSKGDRNEYLQKVIERSGNVERYIDMSNDDGTLGFALTDSNGDQLAQSVGFSTAADRDAAKALFQVQVPNLKTEEAAETGDEKPYEADGKEDNYKPLDFYEKNGTGIKNGFDEFSVGEEHYFSYNLGDNVYLISEGYGSVAARQNGINSVTNNMTNPDRYQKEAHPNGKFYFNLRAGNNKEIATSRWFDKEGDMDSVIARMVAGIGLAGRTAEEGTRLEAANRDASIAIAAAPAPREDKPKKKRKRRTTKKPKAEKIYVANGNYLFNDIRYDIFQSGNGRYYFTFKNAEGKTILLNADVRGYETQEAAQVVVDEIMKYGPFEVNYDGKQARNGTFYFYLKGEDGKNLAKSFFYATEDDMQSSVGTLLGTELQLAALRNKVVDDYLACEEYNGDPQWHRFEQEGEYYFSFNNASGDTFLRSEGYKSVAARENGINSVIKNAPIEERWKTGTEEDGRFYYALRAGNNQEVARSCIYGTEVEMQSAMGWVRGGDSILGLGAQEIDGVWKTANQLKAEQEVQAAAAMAAAKSKRVVDDYLACKEYNGAEGFHRFEQEGEYYFSYNDSDGETFLRSEGYTTEAARENGIKSVIKNAPLEERWVQDTIRDGKYHYYALKAGNHQEIARSCYYQDKAAMLAAFGWVTGDNSAIGYGSQMVGGALMSAAMLKAAEEPEVVEPAKPIDKEDDYLTCAAYEGHSVNDKINNVAFFKGDDAQFYFALYNDDGSVRLRSEGFRTAEERDQELSGVVRLKDKEEFYKRIEKGKYYMNVLYDETGREVGRSCLKNAEEEAAAAAALLAAQRKKEEEEKAAAAAAAAAAATALAAKKKEEEEKAAAAAALAAKRKEQEAVIAAAKLKAEREKAAATAAAAAIPPKREEKEASAPFFSGIWPWILGLLLLGLLAWLLRGCFGCGAVPPPVEKEEPKEEVAPPVVPVDTISIEEEPEPVEPLGPDAAALGFAAGTIEAQLADCLSDPNCDLGQTFTWEDTQYPFNSAKMSRGALPYVDNIAKLLKAYPNANIDIYGFIDGTESDIYTGPYGDGKITLSEIRARCLYKKLAKRGISKSRMTFTGFADRRPIAPNDTEAGRRKNRRTEIKITSR